MKTDKISQCRTNFSGKIIFPEKLSPKLEDFKRLTQEKVSNLIEKQPFDIIIHEVKHRDSYIPKVEYKRISDEKVNPFSLIILDDIISRAKDKILLDEIVEQMNKDIAEKFDEIAIIEIKKDEKTKQKMFTPNKIGRNSQINNKSKLNQKFIKRR